ncbi:MAG: endolytic transglycosylase MltG [Actinomycetota bacterium]|nr:endolytic transglycosylase MltG [Actinomycetota bacterium]
MARTARSDPPVARPQASRSRRSRPGRGVAAFLVAVASIAIVTGGAALAYYRWCQGAGGPQRPVTVQIPQGASGGETVDALHHEGVIRCASASRIMLSLRGVAGSLQAGSYRLTTNMTVDDALKVLEKGPPAVPVVDITIPEGYRTTQIADRVAQVLKIPARKFLAVAQNGNFSAAPYLPKNAGSLEGFLFPKTYEFDKRGVSAQDVIHTLLSQFQEEAKALPWQNARSLGVTPYQVVTIASMVEREASLPQDRPKIAAVIYNRLRKNMTLGIDATLQYVDPNPSDGLTSQDLKIDSPYNTRLHRGLPPTPIASPGIASLRAALQPAQTSDLYYVLCGSDGHHEFAQTYSQFLQLKQQCLGG